MTGMPAQVETRDTSKKLSTAVARRSPSVPLRMAALIACVALAAVGQAWAGAATQAGLLHPHPTAAAPSEAVPVPPTAPLKVSLLRAYDTNHPHRDIGAELTWIERFAAAQGRQVDLNTVSRADELTADLATGHADLVIGDLPPRSLDRPDVIASESFHRVRYRVVGPNDWTLASPLDMLAGQRIALRVSSPLWPYFERLAETYPGVYLAALPEYLPQADVLKLLSERDYDLTVIPDDGGGDPLADFPSLAFQFDLTGDLPIAFVARRGSEPLLAQLNERLRREPLYPSVREAHIRDLARIRDRGVLRVISRPNGQNFYLRRGKPAGFEYHVARNFAAELGVRPEFIIAHSEAEMLDWLRAGIGDLVTMPVDERRVHGDPAIALSREYHYVASTVVAPRSQGRLAELPDLAGLRLAAEQGTLDHLNLEALAAQRPDLGLTIVGLTAPEDVRDPARALTDGRADALVIGGHHLTGVLAGQNDLTAGLTLPTPYRFRWAMRAGDAKLTARVDRYLAAAFERGTYRTASARYFDHTKPAPYDSLTPYDALLQKYASEFQFDWRLLAAVMYQESQFKADALSPDGARGLMQMMPATGESLGFRDLNDPEISIHAGAKYLAIIRDRFDRRLPLRERTWFALAGYNAGPGRIDQARRLAAEMGLDPNVWFDNVEVAMSRLGLPVHRRLAEKNPPCWCDEPVEYVRNISRYYDNYRTFSRVAALRSAATPELAVLGTPLRSDAGG